jgi:CHAP domain
MTLQHFIDRARSATTTATFYWLGRGGWTRASGPPAVDRPGTPFDIESALADKRREDPRAHARYIAAEAQSGIARSSLPRIASDCSGYVCWALGVARDSRTAAGGWFDTNAMVADANGARQWFVPIDRAVPGALLVHPQPSRDGGPGHVAIVTEVDAAGQPQRMLHCSAPNYLLAPLPGLPHNAIAETDTRHFEAEPQTRLVMWKAFA